MSEIAKIKYKMEFTDSDEVVVEHNLDSTALGVALVVAHQDVSHKINSIEFDAEDPTNKFTLYLSEELSGRIHVLSKSMLSIGLADIEKPEFGRQTYEKVSDGTKQTSSYEWQDVDSLTIDDLEAGTYNIVCTALLKGTANAVGKAAYGRSIVDSNVMGYKFAYKDNYETMTTMWVGQLTAGSHTIKTQFKKDGLGNFTACASESRIAVWRVS